ncbi:MAG: methylmalonyl-CoA mutase family protein [Chloroflexi bacterium]|nr:methylmalonyl-CoA mutase family protein [Chloroflexota bacterium]
MPSHEDLQKIANEKRHWERGTLLESLRRAPERQQEFITTSGVPIERLYTPADVPNLHYLEHLGFPGEYPFTRGVHPTLYRSKLWTMRMFSGFGTAEESNARYKYLLEHGETGLSVAFDTPTLYGYDHDHPMAHGEFGKCGVAVSSVADMEVLFDGIPVDQITTSMTINGPAAIIWAMYIAAAQKRGIPMEKLGGTLQNDIFKEYQAQKEFIFPPGPSLRLVVDTIEFGSQRLPLWNTISISGYHIREAGATAVQELAFTLYNGFAYVQAAMDRGLQVDDFAPRLSFFFNSHNDFFEEIAKFRAARRIWAREMKDRFGAKDPRSWWLRFHTQTAGCSLTAQQPENNIVRTTIQALAAVLGGTQSLHTNSMDEALALPAEKAARVALRTQQIIAHESGVTNAIDPFGGSYFVESLTDRTESAAREYFARLDAIGGAIAAIESGFYQHEIADSAFRYEQEINDRRRTIVGVNDYLVEETTPTPLLRMDPEGERVHLARLQRVRAERDSVAVQEHLEALRRAAKGTDNLMPFILAAVHAYATLGEITDVLRDVFGVYVETPAL